MFPLYAALEPEKRICEIITGASCAKKAMAAIMLASMATGSKSESFTDMQSSVNVLVRADSEGISMMMMMMILLHIILLVAGVTYTLTSRKKMVTMGTQTAQLTSNNTKIKGTMTVNVPVAPPPSVGVARVSVSRFGERFHRANCATLEQSTGVRHLTRCAVCNP